jgi:hypothetical protein
MTHKLIKTDNYLLVVDDSGIKVGDYWHYIGELGNPILNNLPTTWFDKLHDKNKYKKVTAHLPLNGSPILEGVPLLPPYSRHQEDGLDDAVMSFKESWVNLGVTDYELSAFSEGYNKAREKYKYTDEDMRKAIDMARLQGPESFLVKYREEEIIQSLHQYPTEFECEMVDFTVTKEVDYSITYSEHEPKPKTITTAQGKQWVGKYK